MKTETLTKSILEETASAKRSFKCSDCRVVIDRDTQWEAWVAMRDHVLQAHQREPYCDPGGQYASDEVKRLAQYGAHPDKFLMLAS